MHCVYEIEGWWIDWRDLGAVGRYPTWLQELRRSSGAFALREIGDGFRVLWVGWSVGRLADTIQRRLWSGVSPGYLRERCECAVRETDPEDVEQWAVLLMRALQPRDQGGGGPRRVWTTARPVR